MDGAENVKAFTRAGEEKGILSGVYTYHLAQMCRLVRPGDKVIDLGCGPANLLATTAKLNPFAHFVGIDLSRPMIDQAGQVIQSRGIRNVDLVLDDISQLSSVQDQTVDVALSSMAIHHLPRLADLENCIRNVGRVLKPGGRLYISDLGRLKTSSSLNYFLRRAVPSSEKILSEDYYASLKAAFSFSEVSSIIKKARFAGCDIFATAVVPIMWVVKTRTGESLPIPVRRSIRDMVKALSPARRADFLQLRFSFWLNGMRSAI